jgi:hypothetical protein
MLRVRFKAFREPCVNKTISVLCLSALALAGCSKEPEELRKPVACAAPARTEPSLDSGILTSATFDIVQQDVAQEKDKSGKTVTTYVQHIVEKAQLPGDVSLEISLGGCEYYANVYTFTLPRTGEPATNTAFWLKKTDSLMGMIEPAVRDRGVNLANLRKELQRRADDPAAPPFMDQAVQGVLPGGEAANPVKHHYQVQVDERADRATVTVQYAVGPFPGRKG